MVYILFLLLSMCYLSLLGRYGYGSYGKFVVFCFPVILLWCLIVGGQYGIGTDYFSYTDIFQGHNMEYVSGIRGEYVFSAIVNIVLFLSLPPQWGFVIIALMEALLLCYIMHKCVRLRFVFLFFFTFVCFCGTFHNQMNGIRQYLAIYMISVIVIWLCKKNWWRAFVLAIVTCFIHKSSMIILPVIVLIYLLRKKDSRTTLLTVILIGIALSIILNNEIIKLVVPYFDLYSHYLSSERIESYGFAQKATKYIYIPLIIWSICKYPYYRLDLFHRCLYVFGIYGFAIKLGVMSMAIVSRIGLYLEIIGGLPIVYLLIYLYKKARLRPYFLLLLLYLFVPYAFKVLVMKTGEYNFDSIFFHWNQLQ